MGTSQDGLDKYRNVIISSGIISSIKDQEERRKQAVWREREINNALKNGSHVCILCGDTDDLLFKQTLSSNSIQFIKSVHHILQIEVHRSEFSTFLDKYGTSFGIFSANKLFDSVICTTPKVHVSALLLQRDITVYKNHGYIIGYTLKKRRWYANPFSKAYSSEPQSYLVLPLLSLHRNLKAKRTTA
jgi:hypothetical protein